MLYNVRLNYLGSVIIIKKIQNTQQLKVGKFIVIFFSIINKFLLNKEKHFM